MRHFPGFLHITVATAAELAVRYFLLAGLAWLLGYVFFRRRWFHRKIIARFPTSPEVRREMAYSAVSVLVFALTGAATVQLARAGHTQIYTRLAQHGWSWFWLSVALTIVLHDTYFYWTHRLMHHPRLFRWFHRAHHLSHNPTPWAAYAFSPLEAVVQAGIFPLALVVMPLHPLAFAIFMGWQIGFNIVGHTGYEIYPRWLLSTWAGANRQYADESHHAS